MSSAVKTYHIGPLRESVEAANRLQREGVQSEPLLVGQGVKEFCPGLELYPASLTYQIGTGSFVVVGGSGRYHHIAAGVLSPQFVKEPTTIIVLDKHIDYGKIPDDSVSPPDRITPSNFFYSVLRVNPNIKQIVFIGVGTLAGVDVSQDIGRLSLYCYSQRYSSVPASTLPPNIKDRLILSNPSISRISRSGEDFLIYWKTVEEWNPQSIPTECIHISVDGDVLEKGLLSIDYEPGMIPLPDLVSLIHGLGAARKLTGADIWGLSQSDRGIPRKTSLDTITQIYMSLVNAMQS